MTAIVQRETAKIYAFPTATRLASGQRRQLSLSAADIAAALRLKNTDFGSGWYHDAAIADDKRDGNH